MKVKVNEAADGIMTMRQHLDLLLTSSPSVIYFNIQLYMRGYISRLQHHMDVFILLLIALGCQWW